MILWHKQIIMQPQELYSLAHGAFSPDGAKFMIANRQLFAYDVKSEKLILGVPFCPLQYREVCFVAFSKDGSKLVLHSPGYEICVLDGQTYKNLCFLQGYTGVCISPDGEKLVAQNNQTSICLISTRTGERLKEASFQDRHVIADMCFSPDGTKVALVTAEGATYQWDILGEEEDEKGVMQLITSEILPFSVYYSICFSPDGSKLLVPYNQEAFQILDMETKRGPVVFTESKLTCMTFSPDGKYIAVAGLDGRINLYTARPLALVSQVDVFASGISSLSFHPDCERLLVTTYNGAAILCRLRF